MKIKFQADADLNEDIVTGVRRRVPEIDFQTATEANLSGVSDLDVLAVTSSENRILVTHDRKTMPGYFAGFIASGRDCAGIFIVSQHAEIGRVIDDLILIWHLTDPTEYKNSIRTLPL